MQSDTPDVVDLLPELPQPSVDPAVAALCSVIADDDACGPDLDLAGDAEYLNFFAQVEGILPTSFFSPEDGKPFDPSSIDLVDQLAAVDELLARSRDIRLLAIRARMFMLNRDVAGFATTVTAIATWLDHFWDQVHPQPAHHGATARSAAIASLTLPTVIFPLQYTALFDGRRMGTVTYRAWMIATGEIKPRADETPSAAAALSEAVANADPSEVDSLRRTLSLLAASLDRIHTAFDLHRESVALDPLRMLVGKMRLFVDPLAASPAQSSTSSADSGDTQQVQNDGSRQITSLATAKQALIGIAEYYAVSEPSSPTLPLVRQAYALIGKSFVEIVNVLVPSQVDKAAFQIGTSQVFDLPLSRLSTAPPSASSSYDTPNAFDASTAAADESRFQVKGRAEALSLLDAVQRFFRHSEPSSPVPMLCERARALAEKDFMSVLENVLPKSSLKAFNADK